MQTDLRTICDELLQLGSRPAIPARRKKLEDAVSSKWDGVKIAAATALSQWGDPQSLQTLKELLIAVAAKPDRWATTGAVARLLKPHLRPSDLDWVFDVYVHKSHADNGFALLSLLEVFPPHEVLRRLEAQPPRGRGKDGQNLRNAISRVKNPPLGPKGKPKPAKRKIKSQSGRK